MHAHAKRLFGDGAADGRDIWRDLRGITYVESLVRTEFLQDSSNTFLRVPGTTGTGFAKEFTESEGIPRKVKGIWFLAALMV